MRDGKRSRRFSGGGSGDTHFGCFGRLQRKLAENSGLTVIEMLCATVILTLLCVMLATGLSMAVYDYRMLTAEAETELLVDTIVSSLTDRLRDSTLTVDEGAHEYRYSLGEIKKAEESADAGITAPAPGTVILEQKGSPTDGEVVSYQKAVGPDGTLIAGLPAGTTITGNTATKPNGDTVTLPAGTTVIEQKALLPDGAYGAVFSKDGTNGKKRRYEVTNVSVSVAVTDISGPTPEVLELPLDNWEAWDWSKYPGSDKIADVTYTIRLTVKDRVTGVSKSTPEDGMKVRCLNPVN